MAKSELITQTEAARLKGMSLAAVNDLVRRGRWRSESVYGKRLVHKKDVDAFEPQPKKRMAKGKSKKKGG
jgi:predicted HTH domain antitoxin